MNYVTSRRMSVEKRQRGDGAVRWVARVYSKVHKKQMSKSFDSFAEARDWEREQYGRPQTITQILGAVKKDTFLGDWLRKWAEEADKTSTRNTRLHLSRNLGKLDRRMKTIGPEDILAWQKSLRERPWADGSGLAESTIATMTKILAASLKTAEERGLIVGSPMIGVKRGRAEVHAVQEYELLTSAEVQGYIDAFDEPLKTMALLAATTGLRIGELAGLRSRSVDLRKCVLHVVEQADGGRAGHAWTGLKSMKSRRVVGIPKVTVDVLKTYIEDSGVEKFDPLFTTGRGTMWTASHAGKALRDACDAADMPRLNWHQFRHFYASTLIAQGVDVVTVGRSLGHASVAVTLDVYAHLLPTAHEVSAKAMESVMGNGDPDS